MNGRDIEVSSDKPEISIITSLFYSSRYVVEFYKRLRDSFESAGVSFEVIFVDDGSPDDSANIVRQIIDNDERVSLVSLSRNFGQHSALITGILLASGQYIAIIDCDLEELPEDLLKMYYELISHNGSIDVIFGVQQNRHGPISKRVGGKLFYLLFKYLGSVTITNDAMVMRVMTRRYVEALRKFNFNNPILAGVFVLAGFAQKPFECCKNYKGSTTYGFVKRMSKAIAFVVNFSTRPAYIALIAGLFLTATTSFFGLWLVIRRIIFGSTVEGWTSLALINFFGIGFSFLMNGVILLYIAEIFLNTSGRPMTIIKEIYRKN